MPVYSPVPLNLVWPCDFHVDNRMQPQWHWVPRPGQRNLALSTTLVGWHALREATARKKVCHPEIAMLWGVPRSPWREALGRERHPANPQLCSHPSLHTTCDQRNLGRPAKCLQVTPAPASIWWQAAWETTRENHTVEPSQATAPCERKIYCCFKPLSFGTVGYTAVNNQTEDNPKVSTS